MKQVVITVTVILFLLSCNKNNDGSSGHSRLVSNSIKVLTYPKLYTKSGETTDRTVVERYLNKRGLLNIPYFYFKTDTLIAAKPDTINLVTSDTAIFSLPLPFGRRIIKHDGPYIYFYMTDTLVLNSRYPEPVDNIYDSIGSFKPYFENFCNSPSCYSPFAYVYDAFIATGEMDRLEFPLLTYDMTRNNEFNIEITGTGRSNYNNVFDISVLNLLQDRDTLVVQTLKRVYTR